MRGRGAHNEKCWVTRHAITIRKLAFGRSVFRIDTHFDDVAQVLLNFRRRKILTVESVAVRTPIRVEVNHERDFQLLLQLYSASISRGAVEPAIFR